MSCIGSFLVRDAVPLLQRSGGYTHTNNLDSAETYYPQLAGVARAFRSPSLRSFRLMADEAVRRGIPFDAFAYDLEGWDQTPEWEQENQVAATRKAMVLSRRYGGILVMGPAQSFTRKNWPQMAPYADMWMIQAQAGQRNYQPGPQFQSWVADLVNRLRPYNSTMPIWAQLSTMPDRPLTLDEYMAYVNDVMPSLVDGIYVFNPRSHLRLPDVWDAVCGCPTI